MGLSKPESWASLLGKNTVRILEEISFRGHPNVKGTHNSTLELTKDKELSPRGDCIVGVESEKSVADLAEDTKRYLKSGLPVFLELVVDERYLFCAWGDPGLELSDTRSLVVRRSGYTCPRTLAVKSTAAASDIPRSIIEKLKRGRRGVLVIYGLAGVLR